VHCYYYTTGFLITLRRVPSAALDAVRRAGSVQPQLGSGPIRALHPLISSLYTQFSALALELDERLDALEQRVLHQVDDQELAEINVIGHRAAVIRRVVTPGRDLAARTPLIQSLPGATSETRLYAEDIDDELQQVVAGFTAIQERSAALAGFWGQNFDVLTGSIEKGWPAFLVLGVGLSVACVAVIVLMLSRRSWKGLRRHLLAGISEFCLPSTVQVDNLPVAFGDALRVKGGTCSYLPCDRQCGHTNAVRFQVCAEHCRGRPESGLPEGNGRKGRDRVIGEPAPGDEDGPEAGGPHGRGCHLRDDDCADDIY
jgi:CorA-like Mg2+ transporter protein